MSRTAHEQMQCLAALPQGSVGPRPVLFDPGSELVERPWFRRSFLFCAAKTRTTECNGEPHHESGFVTYREHGRATGNPSHLPSLNALAGSLLAAGARDGKANRFLQLASEASSLGITDDELNDLLARGLARRDGGACAPSPIVLTGAGLVLLQSAIPLGAIRPVYYAGPRELTAAGEIIIALRPQAHNLCAVLTALEDTDWEPRVVDPLNGRRCRNDPHQLIVAVHKLNKRQRLIDFHADGGAVKWNWRTSDLGPDEK